MDIKKLADYLKEKEEIIDHLSETVKKVGSNKSEVLAYLKIQKYKCEKIREEIRKNNPSVEPEKVNRQIAIYSSMISELDQYPSLDDFIENILRERVVIEGILTVIKHEKLTTRELIAKKVAEITGYSDQDILDVFPEEKQKRTLKTRRSNGLLR